MGPGHEEGPQPSGDLLNTFPFSKENKHTFAPPKHHWRRLGHPLVPALSLPGAEALQQEGRGVGLGTVWSHPYGKIWHRVSLGAPG